MKASVRDFTQTQKTTKRGAKNVAELIEYLSTLHKDLGSVSLWGVSGEMNFITQELIILLLYAVVSLLKSYVHVPEKSSIKDISRLG